MLEIMNHIPDISGSTCEAFIKQEYWYKGVKSGDVHILFLKVKGGKWHRVYFDCGVLFWSEVEAPEAKEAGLWNTPDAGDYQFPQIEIGLQYGVTGRVIEQIKPMDADQWPELHINFSGGITLVLRDFCEYQLLEFRQNAGD